MSEYRLPALRETDVENLGRKIGQQISAGAFIALSGNLGSGKTTFAKAIARGMGVKEELVSSTYTIVSEYQGSNLRLYHIDAYRLTDFRELMDIGFIDYCYAGGVIILEWADRVERALPHDRLDIRIEGAGDDYRIMTFKSYGTNYMDLLKSTVI